MPTYTSRCVTCGREWDHVSAPQSHPDCVCGGPSEYVWRSSATVIGDEWPGGGPRTFENMGHEPVTCDTKSDYRRELKARGLQECVRWAGPGDRHVSRMVTVDAYTLRNAAALVERVTKEGTAHDPEPDSRLQSLQMTVSIVGGPHAH
jgi:hypothetical protein